MFTSLRPALAGPRIFSVLLHQTSNIRGMRAPHSRSYRQRKLKDKYLWLLECGKEIVQTSSMKYQNTSNPPSETFSVIVCSRGGWVAAALGPLQHFCSFRCFERRLLFFPFLSSAHYRRVAAFLVGDGVCFSPSKKEGTVRV